MKLVVITQTVCPYCDRVKNFLHGQDINFSAVNVDNDKNAIEEYGVMSTPVTILFDEDEEIARVVGFNPPELAVLIEQL